MIDKFVPDIYQKSIYDIDYKKLKKSGIKCIIFDLDNTLAPISMTKPSKKIKDLNFTSSQKWQKWIKGFKMNMALVILSIVCLLTPFAFAIFTEIKDEQATKNA